MTVDILYTIYNVLSSVVRRLLTDVAYVLQLWYRLCVVVCDNTYVSLLMLYCVAQEW